MADTDLQLHRPRLAPQTEIKVHPYQARMAKVFGPFLILKKHNALSQVY